MNAKEFFETYFSESESQWMSDLQIDDMIDFAESYAQRQNAELKHQKEAILQQARCWAGEAKAQRSTVNEVGSLLGGVPDWGPIAKKVEAKLRQNAELVGEFNKQIEIAETETRKLRGDKRKNVPKFRAYWDGYSIAIKKMKDFVLNKQ